VRHKGQLKYADEPQRTKVQFHYPPPGGSKTTTRAQLLAQFPKHMQEKLQKSPSGVGLELPIDGKFVDLAELSQQGTTQAPPFPAATRNMPTNTAAQTLAIVEVRDDIVRLDNGIIISRKKLSVTDPALTIVAGNRVADQKDMIPLRQFGPAIEGLNGRTPDIDRNPYNFVEFAGDQPWTFDPSTDDERNPVHSHAMSGRLSGVLSFEIHTKTPLFVPGGFPFRDDRDTLRHFCRMHKRDGGDTQQYAIPGSTIKGVLRSEVEALSNSRLGILLGKDFYDMPIPYRRRSFQSGLVQVKGGVFTVQPCKTLYLHRDDWPVGSIKPGVQVKYTEEYDKERRKTFATPDGPVSGTVIPYRAGLAVAKAKKPYVGLICKAVGSPIELPSQVVEKYLANLKHPHYGDHEKREQDAEQAAKKYLNIKDSVREGLKDGDLIYYTAENGNVTTFGKNINYLWPASKSVTELARYFVTPDNLGLRDRLCMAERLFGFSGTSTRDGHSHPFRGMLRFETAWGPTAESYDSERRWPLLSATSNSNSTARAAGWRLQLAPLTAPATRAKSRPLYLQPKEPGGLSGSWEDNDVKLRGRKFHWPQSNPQSTSGSGLWKHHLRDNSHVKSQLPPEIAALRPGTQFECRIHFRNLTPEELGALLYALEGKNSAHTLRIGKGKPRGLGSVRCNVTSLKIDDSSPQSLLGKQAPSPRERQSTRNTYVEAFQKWAKLKSGTSSGFSEIDHIRSYDNLHWWKEGEPQIRYYPVNFEQYNWMPNTEVTNTAGEPELRKQRCIGMKRAKDIQP